MEGAVSKAGRRWRPGGVCHWQTPMHKTGKDGAMEGAVSKAGRRWRPGGVCHWQTPMHKTGKDAGFVHRTLN
jgi:hypothetical protein